MTPWRSPTEPPPAFISVIAYVPKLHGCHECYVLPDGAWLCPRLPGGGPVRVAGWKYMPVWRDEDGE